MIKAKKLNEAGYEEAILGFGLAMKPRSANLKDWWTKSRMEQVGRTAEANAFRGKGHNKFLRMIQTWWYLDMPRYLSQEFATYKVGTVTSSASTMHRGVYEPVTLDCFSLEGLCHEDLEILKSLIVLMNDAVVQKDKNRFKKLLPESYMLEQIWHANYAVLNVIIDQRHKHELSEWQDLIKAFQDQADHPKLLRHF